MKGPMVLVVLWGHFGLLCGRTSAPPLLHTRMLCCLGWAFTQEGGLSLRGVAFMTVLTVLAVLESTLHSFCFLLPNAGQGGNRECFDGLGGFGVYGGFGHDGFPP